MLQEWLARLPQDAGPRGLACALLMAVAGLVLWLVGARFSRSIFTLLGVAAGAWVGLRVPRWMGWEIDAMAIAIGGALVLGLAGYLAVVAGLHDVYVLAGIVCFEQFADALSTVALFTIMMDRCRAASPGTDYSLQASLQVLATGLAALCGGKTRGHECA
jgi:hypothetical protein